MQFDDKITVVPGKNFCSLPLKGSYVFFKYSHATPGSLEKISDYWFYWFIPTVIFQKPSSLNKTSRT